MITEVRRLARELGMSDLDLMILARDVAGDQHLQDLRELLPVELWELVTDLRITAELGRECSETVAV